MVLHPAGVLPIVGALVVVASLSIAVLWVGVSAWSMIVVGISMVWTRAVATASGRVIVMLVAVVAIVTALVVMLVAAVAIRRWLTVILILGMVALISTGAALVTVVMLVGRRLLAAAAVRERAALLLEPAILIP